VGVKKLIENGRRHAHKGFVLGGSAITDVEQHICPVAV
jgi:hypothetical protein